MGISRIAEYTASKFGVRGMLKALRDDVGPDAGVRVNLVAPTFMHTSMTKNVVDMFEGLGCVFGRVSDVTDAVVRLAVDDKAHGGLSPPFAVGAAAISPAGLCCRPWPLLMRRSTFADLALQS